MRFLRMLAGIVTLLVMIGAGALFALQNTTAVALDLLLLQLPERTVSLWLLLALAIGVVLGLLSGSLLLLRQRARLGLLRRQNDRLTLEIDRLRKVGITDSE